ncbi:conserved hypothetical protein [Paraburkholderia ribeironis]|uniref:YCII-related domain-containing protein n=1 Tax=Paraburkholderia ribeironis TaxID=1247936 RepID=A0A1N7RW08_9BURK|nr:hypothetical protein [Paraburkholderia ribeironis]SIT39292.1 conserved hypothetical protein [Paraburkholderia ribeironis]
MYVVLLRFSANKTRAPEHMAAHREWIGKGIDEGVFLLVGSIRSGQGGAILVAGPTFEELQARVNNDPFVVHDIVKAEIVDIEPNISSPELAFLSN